MMHKGPLKAFLQIVAMVIAIAIVAHFLDLSMQSLEGNFGCTLIGKVTICWSFK